MEEQTIHNNSQKYNFAFTRNQFIMFKYSYVIFYLIISLGLRDNDTLHQVTRLKQLVLKYYTCFKTSTFPIYNKFYGNPIAYFMEILHNFWYYGNVCDLANHELDIFYKNTHLSRTYCMTIPDIAKRALTPFFILGNQMDRFSFKFIS